MTFRLLEAAYFGGTTDASTFVGVAIVLLVVASSASLLPTLRILRVDPATTLRQE